MAYDPAFAGLQHMFVIFFHVNIIVQMIFEIRGKSKVLGNHRRVRSE